MNKTDRPNVVELYKAGKSMESIGAMYGVNMASVRHQLLAAGIKPRSTEKLFNDALMARDGRPLQAILDEIADLYRNGMSLSRIGGRFGITRPAVVKRLRESGVELRTQSGSAQLRFAKMTEAERCQVTKSANASVRGVPRTFEEKCQVAIGKQSARKFGSDFEATMDSMLSARGLATTPQLAIGPYNVDLALEESSVAVEIFGGNWHSFGPNAEAYPERIKYLIDAGWHVVVIWVVPIRPLAEGAADYVVALHEGVCRGESAIRQEWVIWGDGDLKPISESDPRNRPLVISPRG